MYRTCLACSFPLLVLLGGCTTYPGLVHERFELERACPEDRTSVQQRSDLKPVCGEASATPPPDVAADPDRLSLWSSQRQRQDSDCAGWSVWEATGCGQTLVYQCRETSGRNWCTTKRPWLPEMY
jgi:hypothetical protein